MVEKETGVESVAVSIAAVEDGFHSSGRIGDLVLVAAGQRACTEALLWLCGRFRRGRRDGAGEFD